jgi:hypothetical protein
VQIDVTELQRAATGGLSFHRKSNDEIAVGILARHVHALLLQCFSFSTATAAKRTLLRLLNQASHLQQPAPQEVEILSTQRQRVVQEVSRLTRLASFRQQVLFAYGNPLRCDPRATAADRRRAYPTRRGGRQRGLRS